MSGDRPSPEFELIASTRRRWKRDQKLAILAQVDAPGGSVSEVARRHGLHTSLLFRWRRDLARSAAQPPAPFAPSFVPVALLPPSLSQRAPAATGSIEIALAGGRTLRVGSDVDLSVLMRLIHVLEDRR